MDNDKILRTFLEDPIIKEKYNLKDQEIKEMTMRKESKLLIINLIKEVIFEKENSGKNNNDYVVRKIQQYLKSYPYED